MPSGVVMVPVGQVTGSDTEAGCSASSPQDAAAIASATTQAKAHTRTETPEGGGALSLSSWRIIDSAW